jgi:flavin reductase (DIM6/NTAB) family NADH-FMN oxidoreductase RutF
VAFEVEVECTKVASEETAARQVETPVFAGQINASPISPTENSLSTRSKKPLSTPDYTRNIMRSVPSSVVLITASTDTVGDPLDAFDNCFGAIVSSFNTVTIAPSPIISFNLRQPSRTLDTLLKMRKFQVTALHGSEQGKIIANAFLQHQHANAFRYLATKTNVRVYKRPLVESTDNVIGPHDERVQAPHLYCKAVLARMNCEVIRDKCVEVGDHTIVVARVLWAFHRTAHDGKARDTGLIYYNRDFGSVSRKVTLQEEFRKGGPSTALFSTSKCSPEKLTGTGTREMLDKVIPTSSFPTSSSDENHQTSSKPRQRVLSRQVVHRLQSLARRRQNPPTQYKQTDGRLPISATSTKDMTHPVDLFPTFDLLDGDITVRQKKKKKP